MSTWLCLSRCLVFRTFQSTFYISLIFAAVSWSVDATARSKPRVPPHLERASQGADDEDLARAVSAQKRRHFIQASNLKVLQVLPEDTEGRRHQKFYVRLSNGQRVLAVYNIEMCPRIPLRAGDTVSMGGEFLWTRNGGLIHWLHYDPKGHRPHGYVEHNGEIYCGG